jgi:hypothetical protein
MSKALVRIALAVGASCALLTATPAWSKDFTYEEKANQEMARRLKIPVYFAVPGSARAKLSKTVTTSDRLVDFKHPMPGVPTSACASSSPSAQVSPSALARAG